MTLFSPRLALPLGRLTEVRWSPADGERVFMISMPTSTVGLGGDEFRMWSAARAGATREDLLAGHEGAAAEQTFRTLEQHGLIFEAWTQPELLLERAGGFRLLTHSPINLHPTLGPVIGDPAGDFRSLSRDVHEVYVWSAAMPSLAAAVLFTTTEPSEIDANRFNIAASRPLVRTALFEFLPLVREGWMSFAPPLEVE